MLQASMPSNFLIDPRKISEHRMVNLLQVHSIFHFEKNSTSLPTRSFRIHTCFLNYSSDVIAASQIARYDDANLQFITRLKVLCKKLAVKLIKLILICF